MNRLFSCLIILVVSGQALAVEPLSGRIQPAKPKKEAGKQGLKQPAGRVHRSTVTSKIVNREPVDSVMSVGSQDARVYYFTELRGMNGREVIHRWEHKGAVMAEVRFRIRGNRWRIWSSKNLVSGWSGEWKVSVIDASGKALASNQFSFTE